MEVLTTIDARIWQAVIAGLFLAVGWVVNGWQNRRSAARLRAERLRDVHRALFAEIGPNLANLGGPDALDAWRESMIARMRADDGFVPFIPHERNDQVFKSVLPEIHILPRTSIDPVVAYYNQLGAIAAMVEDMRGAGYRRLAPERRILIYSDYVEMKKQAFAFGDHALKMIDAYARGGKDHARRMEADARKAVEARAQ